MRRDTMKKRLISTALIVWIIGLAALFQSADPAIVMGKSVDDASAVEDAGVIDDAPVMENLKDGEEEVNGILSADEEWSYVLNDAGEAVIVGYTGSEVRVEVPETIDSRIVRSVRPTTFRGNTFIKYVYMPGTVDTLWAGSFAGCTALQWAELVGVVNLGEGMFRGCTSLKSVELYEGVKIIPASFCEDSAARLSVYLPKSLESVGENAFKNCMTDSWSNVYYTGSEEDWKKVTVAAGNENFCARIQYDYDPGSGSEDSEHYDSTGNWIYKFNTDESAYISRYVGPQKDEVTLPSEIDGYKIKQVYRSGSAYVIGSGNPVKKLIVSEGIEDLDLSGAYVDEVVLPGGIDSFDFSSSQIMEVDFPAGLKSIESYAFSYCRRLVRIDVPDTVKTVGNYAFSESGLKELTLPGSITSFGEEICKKCDSLKKLTLGEGMTTVNENAFKNLKGLEQLTLPSTLKSIGAGAFTDCVSLKNVTLPENLESVGGSAFSGCKSLGSITIPSSVKQVGGAAFSGCGNLKDIYVKSGVESIGDGAFDGDMADLWYEGTKAQWDEIYPYSLPDAIRLHVQWTQESETKDDFAFEISGGKAAITGYYGRSDAVNVPGSVKLDDVDYEVSAIDDEAFSQCRSITSVTLPASVKSIGDKAFYECTSLAGITFPTALAEIGEGAFYGCTSLENITLPAGVDNVMKETFYGCTSLQKVTFIAGSGVFVGESAFEECTSLSEIELEKCYDVEKRSFYECSSLKEADLSNLQYIGSEAFSYTALLDVSLSSELKILGDSAFGNCKLLKSASFARYPKDGYESMLGTSVFYGDSALESVTLSDDFERISDSMFSNCEKLESIYLPSGVDDIGAMAFDYCKKLSVITVGAGHIKKLGEAAFRGCKALTDVEWFGNADITAVPDRVFYECENLRSLTIPAGAESIGNYAFYHCYALSEVKGLSASNVTVIDTYAFDHCYAIKELSLPAGLTTLGEYGVFRLTGLSHMVLPSGITQINRDCFSYCYGLRSVSFSANVTKIQRDAFTDCPKLKYVYYGGTLADRNAMTINDAAITEVEWIYGGSDTDNYEGDFVYTLSGTGLLTIIDYTGTDGNVVIPEYLAGKKVYEIKDGIFDGNEKIVSVEFDAKPGKGNLPTFKNCPNLKVIKVNSEWANGRFWPDKAFYNCRSLNYADLGGSIPGNYCFEGCVKLQYVTMDDSAMEIGSGAFKGCVSLESIKLPAGLLDSLGYGLFEDCAALETVRVPAGVGNLGKNVFKNCGSLRSVILPFVYSIGDNAFAGCDNLETVCTSMTGAQWEQYAKVSEVGNSSFVAANMIYEYDGPELLAFDEETYVLVQGQENVSERINVYPANADLSAMAYTLDSDIIEVQKDETDPAKFAIKAKAPGFTRITAVCGAARSIANVYVIYPKPMPVVDGSFINGLVPGALYKLDNEEGKWRYKTADPDGRIEIVGWYESFKQFTLSLAYDSTHTIQRVFDDNEKCNSQAVNFYIGKRPADPAVPELVEKTDSSLKVKKTEGYEYTIDRGLTVNETGEFTDLAAGTAYSVGCRIKKNGEYEASGWAYANFSTEGKKPPRSSSSKSSSSSSEATEPSDPDRSSSSSKPHDSSSYVPAVSSFWNVKTAEGNTVTFTPGSEFKDEKGNPLIFEVKTLISVPYTGKKHVGKNDPARKNTSNDVEVTVASTITEYADVSLKFKNNKIVPVKSGKDPQFIISLKAKKTASPEQKALVKTMAKELKKKPVYFIIAPADLTGASINEIKLNGKKDKVSKAIVAIDGNTFKLKAGKDFDYKIEEGKVTLTGKTNFKGSIDKAL